MIKISKRLKTVASYVNKNSIVLDVGTDHALLPMYLVDQKIVKKAKASDIVKSIVERTKKEINQNGFSDKIDIYLSDGLKDIKDSKVDTIIIAGMGGILTSQILNGNKKYIDGKKLILSPHRDSNILRRTLHELNFKIIKETIVEDKKDKFYPVIVAIKGKDTKYSDSDYEYGKKMINSKKQNKDFIKYLKYLKNKARNIDLKLKNNMTESNKNSEKKLEIENEILLLTSLVDKENKKEK